MIPPPASRVRSPRHQSAAAIAPLPAGCTRSSATGAVAVPTSTVAPVEGDLARPRAAGRPRSAARTREQLEPRAVDRRVRAGLGGDAAEPPEHRVARLVPADAAVVVAELRRVRRLALLRRGDGGAGGDRVDDVGAAAPRPSSASAASSVAGGRVGRGTMRDLGEDVAGVELGDELEDARPGLLVAGDQRVLHGRGAAPARQQREVEVDPAVHGRRQQRLADESAVRDDHAEVGLERRDPLGRLGIEPIRADRVDARAPSAAAATGDGVSTRLRPSGASRRVTTAAMS